MTGKKYLLHFILYYLFFLVLFIQFPLSASLPGKIDTWFYVDAFNNIHNYFSSYFGHYPIGTALYPEANLYSFGNYSFGLSMFYVPFKWFGFNDINAYYLFISLVFTFNAVGARLIAEKFFIEGWFAFFSGLIFADCNFAYATLDNPDATFLGWGLFAIYFLLTFFETSRVFHLLFAFASIGMEVYYSSYGFLFSVVFFAIIALSKPQILFDTRKIIYWIAGLVIMLLIIAPYLHLYIFDAPILSSYNPAQDIKATGKASLKLIDLFRPMRYNIYYAFTSHSDFTWLYKTRSAFIGILLPVFGVIAILKAKHRMPRYLIVAFIIFFILACGPFLPIENSDIPSPIYWLYSKCHINQYLRISVRAYFFCVLILCLGAAWFIQSLHKTRPVLSLVLMIAICIENTPYKFEKYNSKQWMDTAAKIPHFAYNDVVLNLPSSFYSNFMPLFKSECSEREDYEFEFIREYLYMYEQTIHKANTINGFTGFIPWSRMNNQILIDKVTMGDTIALRNLIKKNGITHIIWQKKMLNGCDYTTVVSTLQASKDLISVVDNADITVYSTKVK